MASQRRPHRALRWYLPVVCGVVLLAGEAYLLATNHLVHITEVMVGANGNSKIQFMIVTQEFPFQNAWGPQGGETQSRAHLLFFDAAGAETGKFNFPANPPTNGTLDVLIATQEFADLAGAPTPDIIIPPLLNPVAGKVCFKNNPANGFAFVITKCLSYGSFTGDTEGAGTPAAALPIVNTVSLRRTVDNGLNSDFSLLTTPTPRNIANATLTIPVATQVAQGNTLFTDETFLGNGRTCATCHPSGQSFRQTPADVQARFLTIATTFDPLFIGENNPSSFDAGSTSTSIP